LFLLVPAKPVIFRYKKGVLIVKNDFRADAAAGTLAMLEKINIMTASGCIKVLGNHRQRLFFELIFLFISTVCMLNSFAPLPLSFFGIIPTSWIIPMLIGGLAILLITRKIRSWLVKLYLKNRAESFVLQFRELESRPIQIEDGNTYKKVKIVTEDEGICLFEPERRQILIEGIEYRYTLFAKDIYSVEPVSGYSLSGARIKCCMGGVDMDFVLTTSGQGPLSSVIEAFYPRGNAVDLSSLINRTLFGLSKETYRKTLPPPLPVR
jgi:hypothetical protein